MSGRATVLSVYVFIVSAINKQKDLISYLISVATAIAIAFFPFSIFPYSRLMSLDYCNIVAVQY